MKVRFFDPGKSYLAIKDEIDSEVQRVLAVGDLILREDVEKFEENLARFVGTTYAIAVNSGTDALVLALKALATKGDIQTVQVPAYTFKATCGAVITAGFKPVIYDLDEEPARIVPYGKNGLCPIIVAHISGMLSPIPSYGEIIEDAAQALGAVKNPKTFAQCWSFYPAKILGAYGDAGAITTNDEKIADYIQEARNHFKKDNRDFGGNYRMDNLQATILNIKFKYLPQYLSRRAEIAEMYKALKGVTLPNYQEGRVWQDYIVRTQYRDGLFEFLKKNEIETIKNEYPWPLKYSKPSLTKQYEAETLRLPCNPDLINGEIDFVIEKVNEFYAGK